MVTAAFPNPGYEMFVNSAWTAITSDMYVEGGCTYARGRRAEGSSTDYGSATLHLKNLNGKYSNRNPSSPYFGKIGRNTPFRQSLQVPDHFFAPPDGLSSAFQTLDNAAIDITGDIDMRVEVAPKFWSGYASGLTYNGITLATKWSPPSDKSWYWGLAPDGRMQFGWTADGTNILTSQSTEVIRASPGARLCLRVVLDVNNGAGGNTTTFYTSNSMSGPWDQLGAPVIKTGTTSIYNSNTSMWVGNDSTSPTDTRIERKYYRFELRNGIAGAVVANPDWTVIPAGYFQFNDAAGRNWLPINTDSVISDRVYRFVTEGSEWSPRWGVGGKKVITPVETSGIMRRLSQGTKPVESSLFHHYTTMGIQPKAYWPMEDGKFTTLSKSPFAGVSPLLVTNMKMADNDTCPPSAPLPSLTSASRIQAPVPTHANSGSWQVEMTVRMDSAPSTNSTLFEFTTTGSPWTIWRLQVASGLMQLVVESGDGATTLVFATSNPPGMFGVGWVKFTIFVIETPPNLFCVATWQPLLEMGLGVVNANSTTLNSTTAGRVINIDTRFGKDLSGASVGHLAVWDAEVTTDSTADNAFNGDIAGARMVNLSAAKGVPFFGVGNQANEEEVGYQRAETYMDLMREAEKADGGALCEDRATPGLLYRDRASMYTQKPALTIPYGHLTAPIEPTDDDQRIRNQTTVTRKDGSSSTVTLATGPMSVQDFPNGVGLYDQSVTVSLADDSRTSMVAGWLNHLGTWNESRYPRIRLLLHDHPEYIKDILGIDTGAIIRITGTPAWLPPGPIDLMVEGYEETTRPHWWEITFACSPAGPWNVAITNGNGALADSFGRVSTVGSVVGQDMTTTSTSMLVATIQDTSKNTQLGWTQDPTHFPMSLLAGGEQITATGAQPMLFDQFTRSVGAGGWGTATDGQSWTLVGGAGSERSVNGTQGVVIPAVVNSSRFQLLSGNNCRDCEAFAVVSVSALATGGALSAGFVMRYAPSLEYRMRVRFETAGTVTLDAASNGSAIGSSQATGWTYTAGQLFNARMRLVGNTILGKVWPQTAAEPVDWTLSRDVVSSISNFGDVGLVAIAHLGNTNVTPQIRFDEVTFYNPQKFTGLTRSVNGVVKTHVAGSSTETVQVAYPAITAL